MSDSKKRTGAGLAVVGGGLLAWWLLRGAGGRGSGGGRGFGDGGGEATGDRRVDDAAPVTGRPVRLRVTGDGITADGATVTRDAAIALARAAGVAEVSATGEARSGTVTELIAALRAAGIELSLAENVAALRNGSLVYRSIGETGDDYPPWLRVLRGASGVYVIRDRRSGEILYVGESHTDRIFETLTRHFQTWRRRKGWWRGQFAEGHDPGLTYPRDGVEVAVRITRAVDAIDEEARLIRRLAPRDNLLGQLERADVPF